MKPFIVIVAGIPASGKTTYAKHIASKLGVPFIGKDDIKSVIWDVVQFDTATQSPLYGKASSYVLYHIAENIMKVGVSLVVESNFPASSAEIFTRLVEKYKYKAITVLCDADIEVLHKRFCKRDVTNERHEGLKSSTITNLSFEEFKLRCEHLRDFCVGQKFVLDTTNFGKVDYNDMDRKIMDYLEVKQ